jgi:hypothetical protein
MHDNVDHELAMAYGDEFNINNVLGYPLRAFSDEINLSPKLVSNQILKICKKTRNVLLAHDFLDTSILDTKEKEFTTRLEKVILDRVDILEESGKEMLKVSW